MKESENKVILFQIVFQMQNMSHLPIFFFQLKNILLWLTNFISTYSILNSIFHGYCETKHSVLACQFKTGRRMKSVTSNRVKVTIDNLFKNHAAYSV